jgi:hypothetical protein
MKVFNAGTVYCRSIKTSSGVIPSSVSSIKSSGYSKSYSLSAPNITVAINNLKALTQYNVYCYLETVYGYGTSLQYAISSAASATTSCCKSITITKIQSSVYGDTSVYSDPSTILNSFSVSDFPSDKLSVTVILKNSSGFTVPSSVLQSIPSSFQYSKTSVTSSGNFYLSASSPTLSGYYTVGLTVSGTSSSEYYTPSTSKILILSSDAPLEAPVFQSALFGNLGVYVYFIFDRDTDKAGIVTTNWACSSLFVFSGASDSTCTWINSSYARLKFNYASSTALLSVGGTVSLLGNKLRAACTNKNCTANLRSPYTNITASAPTNPTVPIVNINVATFSSPCDAVTIDASSSSGNGGRDWLEMTWSIVSAGADRSQVDSILAILNASDIASSIDIPASLLQVTTYTVTLTLTNFLLAQKSSTATFTVSSDVNRPVIDIPGNLAPTIKTSDSIVRYGFATLPTCATASALSYTWTIVRTSDNQIYSSATANPRLLRISSYTLAAGYQYVATFTVTSLTSKTVVLSSSSSVITIFVESGNVVAVISGGSYRSVPVRKVLTLNGSLSYDEDSFTSHLTYSWTCTIVSIGLYYGSDCGSILTNTTIDDKVLYVANGTLQANNTYEFDLTVVSDDSRESSTAVTIIPSDAVIELSIAGVIKEANVLDKLTLPGELYASVSVLMTWTIDFEGEKVSVSALSDDMVTFSAREASNGLIFPYTIAGGTLVGSRTYTFTLSSCEVAIPESCSFTELEVRMISPPFGGSVKVSPTVGSGLSTVFSYSSTGWLSDDNDAYPFTYRSLN